MTVTDAVCRWLLEAPAVAAMVGARVYQLKLPQQPTLPAIRVQLIAEPGRYHLRGVVNALEAIVQVDAYANEFDPSYPDPYARVQSLAAAIDDTLSGHTTTLDTIAIVGCFRDARMPVYEPQALREARIWQDYRCIYHDLALTARKTRRPEEQEEHAHG